jgi:hypothetical protein
LFINKEKLKINGRVKLIFRDAKTGEITRQSDWIKNIIPNVALNSIANRLSGANTKANAGQATYGAVGTGTTTPAVTDTKLDNELYRNAISLASNNIDNVANIQTFFGKNEANGTITEFGLFGEDATGAADSGILMQHITFNYTKTVSETLTIISQITLNYS